MKSITKKTTLLALLIVGFVMLFSIFPVKAAKDRTASTTTLQKVNTFDYFTDSTTGISKKQFSISTIKNNLAKYNTTFSGPPGMPVEEYRAMCEQEWRDHTVYSKEPVYINFSLTRTYTYDELVKVMKYLSRYEGVYMYSIGTSSAGRTMYALEIDMPSDIEKETIILTGNIHARETAGTTYILKELIDLVQDDSKEAKNVLSRIRFVAVPCVNPDGREGVCFDTRHYTYSNGQLWKATSNGTDLGRNFPGLSWSQLAKGNSKSIYVSDSAKKLYYPGDYGGSCNETKALMKFIYHYVVVEKAVAHIDYHQQGSISYAGKPWDTTKHQKECSNLAKTLFEMMNKGNRISYRWIAESSEYGLNGTGSTMSDYACSVAYGAKFSPGYGFCVYTDGSNEYPLAAIPRMDNNKIKLIPEPNPRFVSMTFEIGYGKEYLGYSEKTRKLLATEYTKYRFDRVLYKLASIYDPTRK